MNAPKKRQSDDRNSHIASLALATPVWLACGSWAPSWSGLGGDQRAAVAGALLDVAAVASGLLRPRLEPPGVHAEEEQDQTGDREPGIC